MLGQANERLGEWDRAIRAYAHFLSHGDTHISGFPDAYNYARRIVDFSNSSKDWTFDSLDSLLTAVTAALNAGSASQLWRYHARVGFFTRTWEQEISQAGGMAGHATLNIADLMRGTRIHHASGIAAGSNLNEAFLRTWGWRNIPVWYLYFRRIYFPMDPAFHGHWEWAGIFYGERF